MAIAKVTHDPKEVLQLYEQGCGAYVTVNETDLTGRKSENIIRVRAVWQEDDNGYDGVLPLEPSMVVETSPGHFHRYWLVADQWPADEKGRADLAAVMERMVESYGSDPNAKDITRVLRVPGFLNRKGSLERPFMVRIVEASERRYTREEIMLAFPPVERKKPQQQPREFQAGNSDQEEMVDALRAIPPDDRHVWLHIGMALKDALGDAGRSLWDSWSATCPQKFRDRDQDRTWRSFRRNGITIATLFHYAKQYGWAPPRGRESTTSSATAPASSSEAPWPQMDKAAYHGLAGEVVAALSPHSEADPIAILIHYLTAFGNIIGNTPYYLVESDRHRANLFAVLVGTSSKGRKGTAAGRIRAITKLVDESWSAGSIASGLSSGEGLINAVRDPVKRWNAKDKIEEVVDPGVTDKRLWVIEPEFAGALAVMERHGNTLSPGNQECLGWSPAANADQEFAAQGGRRPHLDHRAHHRHGSAGAVDAHRHGERICQPVSVLLRASIKVSPAWRRPR